jgi:phosphopantetheinyl transferase (holo-ACP synthase)
MPIGNDIVDLTDPEAAPGAHHPRFAERVCHEVERWVIARAAAPNRMLWAHWAAKESAFKALRQLDPSVRFLPRQLRVHFHASDGDTLYGCVHAGRHAARVEVHLEADRLHALASVDAPAATGRRTVRWRVARRPPEAAAVSVAVRRLLGAALAHRLGCAPLDIAITAAQPRGTPPRVLVRGRPAAVDVSLAHHGRFIAFAYALDRPAADARTWLS